MHFRTIAAPDDAQLDALIVPVFKGSDAASGTPADIRQTAEWVATETGAGKIYATTSHLGAGAGATRIVVVNAGPREEFDFEHAWRTASAGIRALWSSSARRVGLVLDTRQLDGAAAVQAAVEGAHFGMWRADAHRTGAEDRKLPPIEEVLLITGDAYVDAAEPMRRGTFIGEAINWSRGLSNEPANLMTPTHVADAARKMAADAGLAIEVLDEDACRALGMGSYLSVAQGSDQPAKFIVLRHKGRAGDDYDLALVGKGITFDSGGISIKPALDMHLMKEDMSWCSGGARRLVGHCLPRPADQCHHRRTVHREPARRSRDQAGRRVHEHERQDGRGHQH